MRYGTSRASEEIEGFSEKSKEREDIAPGSEEITYVNTLVRGRGLDEIKEMISGIMKGRTMFIGFYLLGPRKSPFTMHTVQVTDSIRCS